MKILLIGEFSALNYNLKSGLEALGHDVTIAAGADGFKKIYSNIRLDSKMTGIIGRLHSQMLPYIHLSKLKNFDIVQYITPMIFWSNFFNHMPLYNYIKNNNSNIFSMIAGDDPRYWREGRASLSYGPFDDFLKYDLKSNNFFMESTKAYDFNDRVIETCNKIIPMSYEYSLSYQGHPKVTDIHNFPINTNNISYKENLIKSKIKLFHGLNRYGFKGTRHVEKAFSYLSKKYPKDLECIIDGKMPLNQYLKVLATSNVVIDQMYSHDLGMNSLYALSMGKVLMTAGHSAAHKSHNINSSPVIYLEPNADSIIFNVEKLLDNRALIPVIGEKSRLFVDHHYNYITVAESFVKTWLKVF